MTRSANRRCRFLLSALVAMSPATLASQATEVPSDTAGVQVNAWVSTAGPYGPLWDLTLSADGTATLEVLFPFNPSGELEGRFTLAEDVVRKLRDTLESQRFFDLPTTLSSKPIPMHAPDLRLDVQVGARHHKVTLYNPEKIKEESTTKRFLRVWEALWLGLPVRPTW